MTAQQIIDALEAIDEDHAAHILRQLSDVIENHADALQKAEPYATRTIARRRDVAAYLHDLASEVEA